MTPHPFPESHIPAWISVRRESGLLDCLKSWLHCSVVHCNIEPAFVLSDISKESSSKAKWKLDNPCLRSAPRFVFTVGSWMEQDIGTCSADGK